MDRAAIVSIVCAWYGSIQLTFVDYAQGTLKAIHHQVVQSHKIFDVLISCLLDHDLSSSKLGFGGRLLLLCLIKLGFGDDELCIGGHG
jgi:hypothetical protein